jgi:serine phosphatase RsbU (regulator of sigma subunit)
MAEITPSYEERWNKRRVQGWQYLANVPDGKLRSLYWAIFFLFCIMGFYGDLTYIPGRAPTWAILAASIINGAYAVLYPYFLVHKPKWYLWLLVAGSCILGPATATAFANIAGYYPGGFADRRAEVIFSAQGILFCVIASYVCFISFIRVQASSALRIQNELDLAHGIQRTLVPPLDLTIPGYEINGVSLPSDKVGGDLVDIVPVSSGTVAYVADVAGHGLQAGILMGMIKTAARTILLEQFDDPATLLNVFCERLNRVLPGVKEAHMYATLAVMHLGRDGRVHYALAGHPAILRYTAANRSVSQLWFEQFPVGLLPVGAFHTREVKLQPGDMLIVSTDGILEACNAQEEEFGVDRLAELTREYSQEPSLSALSDRITTSVRAFGKQADDQTLLLVRRQSIAAIAPSPAEESEAAFAVA